MDECRRKIEIQLPANDDQRRCGQRRDEGKERDQIRCQKFAIDHEEIGSDRQWRGNE